MSSTLAVLVVIAHPDDETLFAGLIHALTHKIHATVDLVCVTNGEGGFRHSAASEYLYDHLQLSKESVARQHLPRIRQRELLGSGRILGVRKHFFYDQLDWKMDRNVDVVLAEQWNRELVIQLLERTIQTGNGSQGYDLMVIMLPDVQSHGHHTASGLLALETIERLRASQSTSTKIPIVLGGAEFISTETPSYALNGIADLSPTASDAFLFHRTWKLSASSDIPDYQMIVLWACSEHKSQGGLIAETLTSYARDIEQYFYFAINAEPSGIALIRNLFEQLTTLHQYTM